MKEHYIVGAAEIFTLFFVMLGPLKMLGPFAKATQKMTKEEIRKLSFATTIFALVALILGGFIGAHLLQSWNIPVPILELTGGLIFLLTALIFILMPKKEPPHKEDETPLKAANVVYSMVVTPYGMATIIALLVVSQSQERTLLILSLLVLVMILNLLSMIFIRQLMGKVGSMILQMLGAVLGILQAALAMTIVISALTLNGPLW